MYITGLFQLSLLQIMNNFMTLMMDFPLSNRENCIIFVLMITLRNFISLMDNQMNSVVREKILSWVCFILDTHNWIITELSSLIINKHSDNGYGKQIHQQYFMSINPLINVKLSNNEHKKEKHQEKTNKQIRFKFKTQFVSTIITILLISQFMSDDANNLGVFPLRIRNDTICGASLGCDNANITQGRSYENRNINISDCFFLRSLTYNGDNGYGGVIYVNIGSFYLNVGYSMFYNCVCYGHGGAIFFVSYNSILKMICANKCSCGTEAFIGQFSWLQASQENQVEFLSILYCSDSISGYQSIRLQTGYQRVDRTNSSMNNAKQVSGIISLSPLTSTCSHCTFSNNKVSQYVCLHFVSNTGTFSYANIVHNNSPTYGVVFVNGESPKMSFCIFQNNHNYLFYVDSGSLDVSHSLIYHSSSSFSSNIAVSTATNNSFIESTTYQIQFFNSLHCNADIPLIDITPVKTYERSQMRSLHETISRTNEETLGTTLERTIDQTNRESPKETIPRTYVENIIFSCPMVNKKEISVIFAILYPMIIPMIR